MIMIQLHSIFFSSEDNYVVSSNPIDTIQQLKTELETIEEENRTFRLIFYASPDPILITTQDSKIIYVNPAWEAFTGYTFAEVQGKNSNILRSGKTPKSVYTKMWKTLTQNQPFTSESVINKKKDGSEYRMHSTIFPIQKQEQTTHYVQIQYDITEQKRREILRGEFLSAAAHELKTPITVLKMITQSHLSKKNMSVSDRELHMIDRELSRLTILIDDILDSTRLETGKFSLRLKESDITQCIRRVVAEAQTSIRTHTINLAIHTEPLTVYFDPFRIEQVLINLLSNAVKYSPEGKEIDVTVMQDDSVVRISVHDEGIGIPKPKQYYIFDKYYQVEHTMNKGFGLGLYISKAIVEQHKGSIWVESEEEKGSNFVITLPLLKPTMPTQHSHPNQN